ncbi:CHAP domain-containing protein [Glaciihabitans sp. dw_435]|uniref:CHAP domain-containing protein n=1 Tax=Glaciihabitans sp. dw_435 TaxID=2720081 RepID=UPI001BD465A7|nr:CHAP domain-containing protein [Glaciihabitans sp. dw_435]
MTATTLWARRFGAVLAATALFAGLAFVNAPAALAGTDDYPTAWRSMPADTKKFDTWGMTIRQCTSFAAFRLSSRNEFTIPFHANAEDWGPKAAALGYKVDTTPQVGSIAWWASNHVAWVESVNADGTITIEEYNYQGSASYHTRVISASGPTGFIHFHDMATSTDDGTFVTYKGKAYRIVGGAAIYVATWDAYYGQQPTGVLSAAQWAGLNKYPSDGTFLLGKPSNLVYTIVGGAPVAVGSWAAYGGKQPTISVSDKSIANAGTASPADNWNHLRFYPADGTRVTAQPSGTTYQITGGAALPVAAQPASGAAAVVISDTTMQKAGATDASSPWSHLRGTITAPKPTIAGSRVVGQKLTAHTAAWKPSAVSLTYQWRRDGVAISKATKSTMTLARADIGHVISVTVAGSKTGFRSAGATSTATVAILNVLGASPVPTVKGTPRVGQKLTAVTGKWAPAGVAFTYQWKRSGKSIPGATAATYTVSQADAGNRLTVAVTGTRTGYVAVARGSKQTAVVTGGRLTAAVPTVAGTPAVGQKLTAVAGAWTPARVTLSYQWKRAGAVIRSATKSSYVLVAADRGKPITVTITGTKSGFTKLAQTSTATAAVR